MTSSRNPFRALFRGRQPLDRRLRMTGEEWMRHMLDEMMGERMTWLGVRALKNPLDAWVYQEIIYEVRPEVIVELGNAFGGGSLFLASMLDLVGGGEVICVDFHHERFEAEHPRVTKVTGSTLDVADQVKKMVGSRRALVIHDASHVERQVLADLRAYADLVSPGSYLIVEDGVRDLISGETGPVAAVETFISERDDFEVDESRERFVFTYNPNGFLKRK